MSDIPLQITSDQQQADFDKKKVKKRSKWSNWLLTVNTNKRFKTYDEAVPLANRLKDVIDEELNKIKTYIIIQDKLHPEATLSREWIKSIRNYTKK